jgi:outer membrane protein insertion porin family
VKAALLLSLACALLPGIAAGQEEEPRGRPEITDLEIRGIQTFATDSLERAIVNRETECRGWLLKGFCAFDLDFADTRHYFHADEFPRDAIRLRLYYWQRGYREARVDTASSRPAEDEIALEFTITEGRPVLVDSIAVLGVEGVDDDDLVRNLPLVQGEPLSMIAVQATRDTLESRLHDAGYAHALVLLATDLPFGSYSADVTYDVDPGPRAVFGPIEVTGNIELEDEVVRRMIGFREGQPYSTTRLLDAQRNIFGLELVQYARVDTVPTSDTASVIPVRVEITEGYEYRVRGGAGWSTAECMSAEARWSARNFMGGARRLQLRGRLSNVLAENLQTPFCVDAGVGDYGKLNWLLAADFNQPWIFSPRNSLSLGIYGERSSLKDIFVRTAVGANVALVRSLGRATPLSFTYRPQLSSLSAAEVYFCTSFLACEPSDIEILQSANWLIPVGVNISTDQTDNLLNPRDGYRFVVDLEHASDWTGSNYAYNRALAEGSIYRGLGRGTAGAGRLRIGWVRAGTFDDLTRPTADVVHPQKRFFSGGSNSVRGYAQNRLGPKVLTVNVTDLLMNPDTAGRPVCTIAQVNDLSCDATALAEANADVFNPQPTGGTRLLEGNLEIRFPMGRQDLEGVGFVDFGQVWSEVGRPSLDDLAWTPGIGARYYSVIGPIRLDLGYRTRVGEDVAVVTQRVRSCTLPPPDTESSCRPALAGGGFEPLDEIALLRPTAPFDQKLAWWQRLQLHFSIGQAF